jgi:DNA-binding transcriptional ArsR family regulator
MNVEPDLSRVARTIGDPTRVRMLTLLMEGRSLTAKELAHGTGVQPATATVHLRRLLGDELLIERQQGRHKYFRLASPEVARCVEALMAVARPGDAEPTGKLPPIQQARFCYDHLAGRVATGIARALLARKLLRPAGPDVAVTVKGERWFSSFGIDLAAAALRRRRFAYLCLDYSERTDHLAGSLGAALAEHMIAAGWLRRKADTRVVTATPLGRTELADQFGVEWE